MGLSREELREISKQLPQEKKRLRRRSLALSKLDNLLSAKEINKNERPHNQQNQ